MQAGKQTGKRRLQAFMLCGVLVFGLMTGCAGMPLREKGGNTPLTANLRADAAGVQDAMPVRADLDSSQMEYVRFDASRMDTLAQPLLDIAQNGGSQEDFDAADTAISDALYDAATMYALIEIRYSQNPADEEVAQEALTASDILQEANGVYWSAMKAVARSGSKQRMENHYTLAEIEYFYRYDETADDTVQELTAKQDELVQQYYTLSAAEPIDADAVRELYVQLVELRRQIAAQQGYDSYAAYAYEALYARDYSPEDAQRLWAAAKENFLPLLEAHRSGVAPRASKLYYDSSIPVDADSILAAMSEVLPQISPRLMEPYTYLTQHHLYDIALSDEKMDAGYTSYLYSYNEPFIFNYPTGSFYDYTTLFHEYGHFVSMYRHGSDLLFGVSDNDLCELQSQGMEALFLPYYEQIFGEADGPVIRDSVVINLLYSIIEGAMYDEFQQKVFAEPNLTPDRVQEIYNEVAAEYGYDREEGYETDWMSIPHTFDDPFYYISYAASAVPALELYGMPQSDAVAAYMIVSDTNPEKYYCSQALNKAGLSDVFDNAACARIAAATDAKFTY